MRAKEVKQSIIRQLDITPGKNWFQDKIIDLLVRHKLNMEQDRKKLNRERDPKKVASLLSIIDIEEEVVGDLRRGVLLADREPYRSLSKDIHQNYVKLWKQ